MNPLFYIPIVLFAIVLIVFIITLLFFRYAILGRRLTKKKAKEMLKTSKSYAPFADKIEGGIDWITTTAATEVSILSYDNLKLFGRIIRAKENNDKIIILFHGWTSIGFFDFSCIGRRYNELGYDVLIVDQRAHGISEGKYTTFGVKERYDVISWVEYIVSLYGEDCKIIIEGISMGASTVLMSLGLNKLPSNVKGVIADCGFTSAADEFTYVLKRDYNLPPFPFLYTANILARCIAGFGFWDVSAENEVKKSSLPLLIIHGEDDDFVPIEFGRRIFNSSNSKNKALLTVPKAKHGISYLFDEERCDNALKEFLSITLDK